MASIIGAETIDVEASLDGDFTPTVDWLLLPTEICLNIFGYLKMADRVLVATVCTRWRNVVYHKSLWQEETVNLQSLPLNPTTLSILSKRGIERVFTGVAKSGLILQVAQGLCQLRSLTVRVVKENQHLSPRPLEFDTDLCLTLSGLTELNLDATITAGSLEKIAAHIPKMISLGFGARANISNSSLKIIRHGFSKLKRLDLRCCVHITDTGFEHLFGPDQGEDRGPRLTYLALRDCKRLTRSTLRHLYDHQMRLTETDDHLKTLLIDDCCNLDGIGMLYVAKISSLRQLHLSGSHINAAGLSVLARGKSRITTLDLSLKSSATDKELLPLANLTHLQHLTLSCEFDEESLFALNQVQKQLLSLDLSRCRDVSVKDMSIIFKDGCNLRQLVLARTQIDRELWLMLTERRRSPELCALLVNNQNVIDIEKQMAILSLC